MSPRSARSVLAELRPPGGWHQPTTPAHPPEPPITRQAGASGTDRAEPLAAPASPAGPPPVAAARPRPISREERRRQQDATRVWIELAACRGLDAALFFPTRGEWTREAREVCGGCPVRAQCLEHALDAGEKFGIWGGKTERQRRAMRRARQRAGRAA
jgi:WhiB family redox-sensing transcriptional regulator